MGRRPSVCGVGLRHDFIDQVPMNVGQPEVATGVSGRSAAKALDRFDRSTSNHPHFPSSMPFSINGLRDFATILNCRLHWNVGRVFG